MVIGLIHAYLIWFGDVLFIYGLCGLVLYPMRRVRPAVLIGVGVVLIVIGLGFTSLFGAFMAFMRGEAAEAQSLLDAGRELTEPQRGWLEGWNGMSSGFDPTPQQAAGEVASMRAGGLESIKNNANHAWPMHLFMIPLFFFWRVTGVMLMGMGLMKLGVFDARRSTAFYRNLMLAGYGVGVPIVLLGARELFRTGFNAVDFHRYTGHYNAVASVFIALGHVGLVMTIWKTGVLGPVTRRLGAVGRMALTNYLAQSLICTTIFYGWGLGHFGDLERSQLMLVVLGVWMLELVWSPLWLARFRFGPAEWLWRSLTYARAQPMRT